MKPCILVTRPVEDTAKIAAIIEAAGFSAVFAPVLQIRDTHDVLPAPSQYDAAIFSSANGVRAFMRRKPPQDFFNKPVFAVGNHTASAAEQAGFTDVRNAGGQIGDVAARILLDLSPPVRLAHFRGRDAREEPASYLPQAAGWQVDGITLYQADMIEALPSTAEAALQSGAVAAALFYSARSAKAFVKAAGSLDFRRIRALCLADSVVKSLDIEKWAAIRVAEHPDQSGMAALIEALGTEINHDEFRNG